MRSAICAITDRVVRDKEVGHIQPVAQVRQHVQHVGLHRDVERRHRLVTDDELRRGGERARDADALLLAAGQLVGIAPR
jgi:hypothetical protein